MVIGGSVPFQQAEAYNDGSRIVVRNWYVTDRDGHEHLINSDADIQAILAQMTPEERAQFEMAYRFVPIESNVDCLYYTGMLRDL